MQFRFDANCGISNAYIQTIRAPPSFAACMPKPSKQRARRFCRIDFGGLRWSNELTRLSSRSGRPRCSVDQLRGTVHRNNVPDGVQFLRLFLGRECSVLVRQIRRHPDAPTCHLGELVRVHTLRSRHLGHARARSYRQLHHRQLRRSSSPATSAATHTHQTIGHAPIFTLGDSPS